MPVSSTIPGTRVPSAPPRPVPATRRTLSPWLRSSVTSVVAVERHYQGRGTTFSGATAAPSVRGIIFFTILSGGTNYQVCPGDLSFSVRRS